jgi:hypothetical protein
MAGAEALQLAGALLVAAALLTGCQTPKGHSLARDGARPRLIAARASEPSDAIAADTDPRDPALELEDRNIDWQLNPTMKTLGRMAETLTESTYSHGFQVDERRGIYAFDCSGMVTWVLRKSTPLAARSTARGLAGRPLARDFQRRIASVLPGHTRDGWSRVARVQDAAPGDVVAWLKPRLLDSANTGHVAFVVLPPRRVPHYNNAYLVRVADSTSLLHDRDTRVGRNGFGLGTILLVTDPETGAPQAYGWVGLQYRVFETAIVIGRPVE